VGVGLSLIGLSGVAHAHDVEISGAVTVAGPTAPGVPAPAPVAPAPAAPATPAAPAPA